MTETSFGFDKVRFTISHHVSVYTGLIILISIYVPCTLKTLIPHNHICTESTISRLMNVHSRDHYRLFIYDGHKNWGPDRTRSWKRGFISISLRFSPLSPAGGHAIYAIGRCVMDMCGLCCRSSVIFCPVMLLWS